MPVLSLGMGVYTSAILLRWLRDPASRDFDLADLVVVTTQLGSESRDTVSWTDGVLVPEMAAAGVRWVQLGRAGRTRSDGYVVLDDSRSPSRSMAEGGPWTLHEELRSSGTVAQVSRAKRHCAQKHKGDVIDAWIADEFRGRPYRHFLGYALEEPDRWKRDCSFDTDARCGEYPLVEWGWDRSDALAYLEQQTGLAVPLSACHWCPFRGSAASLPATLAMWDEHRADGVDALALEHTARRLNPAALLFGRHAAADRVAQAGLTGLLSDLDAHLAGVPWTVYRVRRILTARRSDPTRQSPATPRAVQALAPAGTREQAAAHLTRLAAERGAAVGVDADGIERAWLRRRAATLPTVEELLVTAPAVVADNQRKGFEAGWAAVTGQGSPLTAGGER